MLLFYRNPMNQRTNVVPMRKKLSSILICHQSRQNRRKKNRTTLKTMEAISPF
ncbi:hypothetical protein Ciccas_005940 [Cichlidogyrus casuarinus]|uniref:Uncharacterized protein n=1 Tax=Cichlidogyrus casuarinus TaxID=1844966 RepID=A0ABD2Q783_9PLAT